VFQRALSLALFFLIIMKYERISMKNTNSYSEKFTGFVGIISLNML
jgi:hypothetical protein